MAPWILAHRIPNSFLQTSRSAARQDSDPLPGACPWRWTQPLPRWIAATRPTSCNFPCWCLHLKPAVLCGLCRSRRLSGRPWQPGSHTMVACLLKLSRGKVPAALTCTPGLYPLPGLCKDRKRPYAYLPGAGLRRRGHTKKKRSIDGSGPAVTSQK